MTCFGDSGFQSSDEWFKQLCKSLKLQPTARQHSSDDLLRRFQSSDELFNSCAKVQKHSY